jgi:phage-related protein
VSILGEWRVIYVARFKDAVYVPHAFHEKTQKTRKEDSNWRHGDTSR